jgi:hypothetical protein
MILAAIAHHTKFTSVCFLSQDWFYTNKDGVTFYSVTSALASLTEDKPAALPLPVVQGQASGAVPHVVPGEASGAAMYGDAVAATTSQVTVGVNAPEGVKASVFLKKNPMSSSLDVFVDLDLSKVIRMVADELVWMRVDVKAHVPTLVDLHIVVHRHNVRTHHVPTQEIWDKSFHLVSRVRDVSGAGAGGSCGA